MCGELELEGNNTMRCTGSSPRVWGTLLKLLRGCGNIRFIPTCVGNSPQVISPDNPLAVHPHVCGELAIAAIDGWKVAGSSPRVWGTLFHSNHSPENMRFIPTCVGNSLAVDTKYPEVSVHPHVCGELTMYNCRVRI